LGFTGATNAKAGFDLSKVGTFATAIAKADQGPARQGRGQRRERHPVDVHAHIDYGVGNTVSGDIKVGNKLVLVPQLLRSIEIREKADRWKRKPDVTRRAGGSAGPTYRELTMATKAKSISLASLSGRSTAR
jgi:hypothetical protein